MPSLRTHIDRWLFEEYRTDCRSLGLYRILFGLYILLTVLPDGMWLRDLPPPSFSPPVGIAALFERYPPYWVMVALNAATLFSICSLIIGWNTPLASLGAGFGFILLESFVFADGKIDHTIFCALIPLTLSFSGWGAAYSVDSSRSNLEARRFSENQAWLLATLAMLIGLALFAAGVAKIHGGWLRADTLGTRWNLVSNYYVADRRLPAALWAMQHFSPLLWKCLDVATVCWEVGFVLTVPRRTPCRVACALGTFFHLGVWQLLDITFPQAVLAYGAFVSWAWVSPETAAHFDRVVLGLSSKAKYLICAVPFSTAFLSLFVLRSSPTAAFRLPIPETLLEGIS